MAVQYFYPDSSYVYPTDNFNDEWMNQSSNTDPDDLYTNIDEGVPDNDADYIFSQTNSSGYWSNTDGYTGYLLGLDFSDISNIDGTYSELRIRAKNSDLTLNGASGGIKIVMTASHGPYIIADSPVDKGFYQPLTNNYVTYSIPALYNLQYGQGIYSCRISSDTTGLMETYISSIELFVSGVYRSSNNNHTLFIKGPTQSTKVGALHTFGPIPDTSGTTLYTQGPIPNTSGTTLYTYAEVPSGQITLHTLNSVPAATGIPLYIGGYLALASGCDLYMNADVHGDLPLFMQGKPVFSNSGNIPLFIRTQYSFSGETINQCTLHTLSKVEASGDIPLTIFGPSLAEVNGNTFPLFVPGPVVYSLNNVSNLNPCSLFVGNYFGSGNSSTTLMIKNVIDSSGSLNLYIPGGGTDTRNNSTTLFINNFFSQTSGIPLYMPGGVNEGHLNLNITGRTYEEVTKSATLIINATDNSGVTKFTNLYIKCTGNNQTLPLFVKSSDSDENSDSMNLYIENTNTSYKDISLYLNNANLPLSSGIRTFIRGAGENDGYYSVNSAMPLFINRGNDSVAKAMTCFMCAPETQNNTLTLHLNSANIVNSGITMSLPNVASSHNNTTPLFVHGY